MTAIPTYTIEIEMFCVVLVHFVILLVRVRASRNPINTRVVRYAGVCFFCVGFGAIFGTVGFVIMLGILRPPNTSSGKGVVNGPCLRPHPQMFQLPWRSLHGPPLAGPT